MTFIKMFSLSGTDNLSMGLLDGTSRTSDENGVGRFGKKLGDVGGKGGLTKKWTHVITILGKRVKKKRKQKIKIIAQLETS